MWTELLRILAVDDTGTIGDFLVIRGANSILVVNTEDNTIILDFEALSNVVELTLAGNLYLFMVLTSGDIVLFKEN